MHREVGVLKRSAVLGVAAVAFSGAVGIAVHAAGAATPRPPSCARQALIELPVNAWAQARSELAPPGASSIRLCRYNTLGGKPLRSLAASALVSDSATVGRIVHELDSLPKPPRRAYCPMDNGAVIDLLIAYGSADHGVFVQVDLTGCVTVDNGSVIRTAADTTAGHALLAKIEELSSYKGKAF